MSTNALRSLLNETKTAQNPEGRFNTTALANLIASSTPAQQAPKIDRRAAFDNLDLRVSDLSKDALQGPTVVKPVSWKISLAGSTRDATPEERANGLGKPVEGVLSPEAGFKFSIQQIMNSSEDPAAKEKKIKSLQSAYKQREYEVMLAPVQAYWNNKLVEEHDEDKHAQRVTGWLEAWKRSGGWGYTPVAPLTTLWNKYRGDPEVGHRFREVEDNWIKGVADVAGGVAGVFGAEDYARAAYLATKAPELADTVDADWVDKALGISTRAAPYMVATVAASAVTGGAAAFMSAGNAGIAAFGAIGSGVVSFGVEGNSAYQTAIDAGVDETTARQIGLQTGLINAAIEAIPFGGGMKYVRPLFIKKVHTIATSKLKAAGKWTIDRVKQATQEALEEAGQEVGTMYGESQYREIKGKEFVDRALAAGAGGFLLGGTMGLAMSTMTQDGLAKEVAKKIPPVTPAPLPIKTAPADRFSTEETRQEARDAISNYFRQTGIVDEGAIKNNTDEVVTLADEVIADHITPEYAQKMAEDHGLGNLPLDQIRVLGSNNNQRVIRIYNDPTGQYAFTALHEVAEEWGKAKYGDDMNHDDVVRERAQYEKDNPESVQVDENGKAKSNREWFADLASEYAIHQGIHTKAGKTLRQMFDHVRSIFKELLARVHNLRKNIASGRVSATLQEMLAAPYTPRKAVPPVSMPSPGNSPSLPFQGRGGVGESTTIPPIPVRPSTPAEQSIRARAAHAKKDHIKWFKQYQKNPTKQLRNSIYSAIKRVAEAEGVVDPLDWRPFVPPELAKETAEWVEGKGFEAPAETPTLYPGTIRPLYGHSIRPLEDPEGNRPSTFNLVASPIGGGVTAPRAVYADKTTGDSKNVWVRPIGKNYSIENGKRTLLMQFSSPLLTKNEDPQSKAYFDKLYAQKPGYHRPDDFWEIPQWIAEMAQNVPNADVYVVRDMAEAKQFLKESGYKNVAFSALDVNQEFIRDLASDFDGEVSVGGYVGKDVFKDSPNVKRYDTIQAFTKAHGLGYKIGSDYRHFAGTKTVARLCLSKGCLHRCAFCSVSKDLGKKGIEEASPEAIEAQIKSFKGLYTPLVYLNDKTFGQAASAAKIGEYGDQIAKQNPEFQGFIIQTTASAMRKFSDQYLQASHIKGVEIGVESFNDSILGAMHKPASTKFIDAAAEKIRRNGLEMIPNIMVGLPGETKATYQNTLDFLQQNADIVSHVNIYNLALYEGTELKDTLGVSTAADLSENAIEKSWMKDPALHKWFSREVYKFATKQLDKNKLTFDLRPLEAKVAKKHTPVTMSSQAPIGIMLSNGTVIPVPGNQIHADIAAASDVGLTDLLKEGAVRYRYYGGGAGIPGDIAIETGAPMTPAQRDALVSFMDEHPGTPVYFDYTAAGSGEGFQSWAYLELEDAAKIVRDMQNRLGGKLTAVPTYDLRPIEKDFIGDRSLPRLLPDMDAGFIFSNGRALDFEIDETHYGAMGGDTQRKTALLNEGAVRFRRGGGLWADAYEGEVIFEARQPLTFDQRAAIEDYLKGNFGRIQRVIFEANLDHYPRGSQEVYSYAYSGDEDATSSVQDMQSRLEGAIAQMSTYRLQRSDTSPVAADQKVQLSMIPEILGQTEAWAKVHMASITNKTEVADLNYGEANQVIVSLQDRARVAGIRMDSTKTFADWLAILIKKHSKVVDEPVNGIRPGDLAATWKSMKKGLANYWIGGARIERLIWGLNGYEQGSLYNAMFRRVREAHDRGEVAAIDRADTFKSYLDTEFTREQRDALLSRKQEEILPGKYLDPSEQISFYLMSKNEHGLRRLVKARGFSSAEVVASLKWIQDNRPDVVKIAKWMEAKYEEQFPRLDVAHFKATGDHLNKEDFYSPLYLKDVELEQQNDFMADLIRTVDAAATNPRIGETIDRSAQAFQDVHMDAFSNYLFNSRRVERYIELAPAIATASRVLNNRNFKAALNNATSGYGNTIYSDWLRDTARGYASEGQSFIDKTARFLRRKSMTYVLGAKVVASLRQTISMFKTLAVDPAITPLVVKQLIAHPLWSPAYRRLEAEVFGESDMMKARSWDRIEAQLSALKTVRMKLQGKSLWDEKLLSFIRVMDKYTAVTSWKASKDLATGRGMSEPDAIRFADEVIRRTQSMGSAVDLPAFFRGGTLAKLLTTFENDSNQNFNYWKDDVIGAYRAGKIGLGNVSWKMLMSYILPALMMGAIGRGGAPEDWEEVAVDMATFPASSFVLFGRWAYALAKGFDPGNTIMDVPLNEAKKLVAAVKKGDVEKSVWQGAKTVSAFTGLVPQQAYTTAEGIQNLSSRETTDLRELLWTKSQLETKKKSEPKTYRERRAARYAD